MAEQWPNDPRAQREAGYERSDANARIITWVGVGLLGAVVLSLVIVAGFFRFFYGGWPRDQELPVHDWVWTEDKLLEVRESRQAMVDRAEQLLQQYAWENEGEGVVRMPVEDAMHIIAEEGMPSWAGSGDPSTFLEEIYKNAQEGN